MPRFFTQPDDAPALLSPRQAREYLQGGAVLLDIREPPETNYRVFDVPSVVFVPHSRFQERHGEIPHDVPLIVADAVGIRAKEIARFLRESGFPDVAWMAGGIVEWVRAGLPVRRDLNYELRGQCGCKLRPRNPKEAPHQR